MARVLVSLPDELLKALDSQAVKEKYNRSEYLRHIIRAFLYRPTDTQTIKTFSAGVVN